MPFGVVMDKLTVGNCSSMAVIHPETSEEVYAILMTAVYQNIRRINTRLG